MSVLFRCRIDKALLARADKVTHHLGTSTAEMFRIFVAVVARTGKIPLNLEVPQGTDLVGPWEQRAQTLEAFYDSTKAW